MKWKKQRREWILHERATERTFLSPTFAAIQLKRLRKSAVLARASRHSRKVSLLRELVKKGRGVGGGRDAFRVVIGVVLVVIILRLPRQRQLFVRQSMSRTLERNSTP